MSAAGDEDLTALPADLGELTAVVRRVVRARLGHADEVDDLVQETLARVLGARARLADAALGPYAIVTARNLVTSYWRRSATSRRNVHRLFDPAQPAAPDEPLVEDEENAAVRDALRRLPKPDRDMLIAHEVEGELTADLAGAAGSTAGAIAARLGRSRAKLRVEYLLVLAGEPPSERCRPSLLALSAGDRRRQAELDVGYHLLECEFCAEVSESVFDRRSNSSDDEARIVVRADPDVVAARQRGRELAIRAGFAPTEATMIATAISEIARNVVRFAHRGEMRIGIVEDGSSVGLSIVTRDVGPGIDDLDRALEVGFTTYGGRGLGLPGSRRLMDEFEITSEVGRGTTVSMTKWR